MTVQSSNSSTSSSNIQISLSNSSISSSNISIDLASNLPKGFLSSLLLLSFSSLLTLFSSLTLILISYIPSKRKKKVSITIVLNLNERSYRGSMRGSSERSFVSRQTGGSEGVST